MDLRIRELAEQLVVRAGSPAQPFGLYVVAPDDPAAELGRHVERQVFLEYFGNSEALLAAEYGPYEAASMFLCVVDHRRLVPAGVMRMILPSAAGQKTVDDMQRVWEVVPDAAFDASGITFERTQLWDISTLAVAHEYRGRGSEGLISLALYQAAFQTALPAGIGWFIATLDAVVLELIESRLSRPFTYLAGIEPKSYLDSPATLPVCVDIDDYGRRLRAADPQMHALLFGGTSLEAAIRAPDWAADVAAITATVSRDKVR